MADAKSTKINTDVLSPEPNKEVDRTVSLVAQVLKELIPTLQANAQPAPQQNMQGITASDIRSKVIREMEQSFQNVVRANAAFTAKLVKGKREDRVAYRVPRVYKKYFGPYLPASINGVTITIPIDNKFHMIPKIYKDVIESTLNYEDEKIDFMERTESKDILGVSQDTLGQ